MEVKVPKKTTGMLPVGDDAAASVSFSLRVRAGRRECEALKISTCSLADKPYVFAVKYEGSGNFGY